MDYNGDLPKDNQRQGDDLLNTYDANGDMNILLFAMFWGIIAYMEVALYAEKQ